MKKRVEELISGSFEYAVPRLVVSEESIVLTLTEGETHRGEFEFSAEDDRRIKGMLLSDNRRIVLSEDKFSDSRVQITYEIDTRGLRSRSHFSGVITILSDIGESTIPVSVSIETGQTCVSMGKLHSLDDFTQLAREDYREAFRVFTSEDFWSFAPDEREKYEGLYKGMSQNPVTYQHMEEFLIGAGKKEAVTLTLNESVKELSQLEGSVKDTLYLHRDNWGYIRAEVETEGDFLEVEKKIISAEDFVGSMYGLEYIVNRDKLGRGKNYGKIRIKTVYGNLSCEICAAKAEDYQLSTHSFENKIRYRLAKSCLDHALELIDDQEWQQQTEDIISETKNAGSYHLLTQLYEAWVALCCDDIRRARDLTDVLIDRRFGTEESQEEGTYLYLCERLGDGIEETERLWTLFRRNPKSVLLLSILMKEDVEIKKSPVKQLDMMEQQFELGVTSPFLYLQAYRLIEADANQFYKLSPFMMQVLNFARKNRLMTEELAIRISYLAGHEKRYKESLYQLLCFCYELYPNRDTVEAICRLIMQGSPRQARYFQWYALAVELDLRITRLYEFYIETMSRHRQESLPRAVQLYFSYNNTLSSERKAFVYAKIIKNKKQAGETYESYREAMEEFAWESLEKEKINEDYAALYQEFIKELKDRKYGEAYVKIMFTYRLYSDDPKVRNVIVCHNGLKREESYPFREGVAYIRLYTKDATILFEDAMKRRYVSTVDYNLQRMVHEPEVERECMALGLSDAGLVLHACQSDPMKTEMTVRNMAAFQMAADSDAFEDEYRCKVRRKLLAYYDKNAGDDTLNQYLGGLDYDEFYKVDYPLLQEVLIRHDFCKEAFSLIEKYGYEEIDTGLLFKLCREMILEFEFTENEELLYLAYYVMEQGKYDEVILGYLRDGYIGSAQQMTAVWERLKGFSMDSYDLEEEILLISMYTRVHIPKLSKILESYIKARGKEVVISSVLTYLSYAYFMADVRIDMFVFKTLERVYEQGWDLDCICELALLKRYRFSKKLSSYQRRNIKNLLNSCLAQNLRFEFFKSFPEDLIRGLELSDKVFVEEQVSPHAEVVLHYAILHREGEEAVYQSEPQKNSFHGIFVREFLLFYGEKLKYYMTVTDKGETYQTEEKVLSIETAVTDGSTKYEMINQMLADLQAGDQEKCRKVMQRYRQMEYLTQTLFTVVE